MTAALLVTGVASAAEATAAETEQLKKDIEELRTVLRNAAQAQQPKVPDNGVAQLRKEIEDLRHSLGANALKASPPRDDTAELKKENEVLRLALNEALKMAVESKSVFKNGQVLSVIKVTTSKEEADAFVKAFTDSPKASHKMKGFRGLAVAENVEQPGSFMVISLWDDEESLNAYVSSKGFGEDHEKSGQVKSATVEPPGRFVVKEN
jgi:heme-degrading monooxygenase HmoA